MSKTIINDIDVSECVRLAIDNISCDLGGECKGWDNCYYKQLQRLKHQYADVLKLAKENADSNEFCLQELEQENERLKAELKKYEDMAKKGLEEFKDVGGCWGCGIQESLNQAWADCKNYRKALQEIREYINSQGIDNSWNMRIQRFRIGILDLINKAEEE